MSALRLTILGLLVSLLVTDTVLGGLFGFGRRRWERRKAEIRSELLWNLSHKMDDDLAREVESIRADLTAVAQQQVQVESEKLQTQVTQAMARLQQRAAELVDAESERLDKQVVQQVRQLRSESRKVLETEAAKLAERSKAVQTTMEQELAKLPAVIAQQVEKSVEQKIKSIQPAPKAPPVSKTPAAPDPAKKRDAGAAPEKATLSKKPEVTEEKQ